RRRGVAVRRAGQGRRAAQRHPSDARGRGQARGAQRRRARVPDARRQSGEHAGRRGDAAGRVPAHQPLGARAGAHHASGRRAAVGGGGGRGRLAARVLRVLRLRLAVFLQGAGCAHRQHPGRERGLPQARHVGAEEHRRRAAPSGRRVRGRARRRRRDVPGRQAIRVPCAGAADRRVVGEDG
ncbi:hypothetical protein LTR16_010709, partial [Cryomyces antarcticus]